jgi:hypothetical protein
MLNVLLLNAYSANHAERLRHLLTTNWQVSTLDESEREASLEAALRSADAKAEAHPEPGLGARPRGRGGDPASMHLLQCA